MISLNYFFYFFAIFVIFLDYTNTAYLPDPSLHRRSFVTNVTLIREMDPRHPKSLCMDATNNTRAEWNDGYFRPINEYICLMNIRCFAPNEPHMILPERPMEGVECIYLMHNGAYRWGCLNGRCVPFRNYPLTGLSDWLKIRK